MATRKLTMKQKVKINEAHTKYVKTHLKRFEFRLNNEKEADMILQKIPKGAWFCTLTPEGKLLSSEKLANTLKDVKLSGKSSACFLIGSSFGMSLRLKNIADLKLSMSPMTFPHHLARVMVLEQLYRAEAIQAGSKYHK